MNLITNLQKTVSSIFDIYKEGWKKYYAFSLGYVILSMLMAIFVSVIFATLVSSILDGTEIAFSNIYDVYIADPLWTNRVSNLISAIITVNFSIYGIYLFYHKAILISTDIPDVIDSSEAKQSPGISIKRMLLNMSSKIWSRYFIYFFIMLLVYGVFYNDIFNTEIDLYWEGGDMRQWQFHNWINQVAFLLKEYVPYLFAMLLVIYYLEGNTLLKSIAKYRQALLSVLILSFCINEISDGLISYFNIYIAALVSIPFINEVVPFIFSGFISLLIIAFFYPGLAGAIVFPFKHAEEKITAPIENEEGESVS